MRDTVLVYRNELLRPSETFIAAQAGSLTRFVPVYVGLVSARDSLTVSEESVLLSRNQSLPRRLVRLPYQMLGVAPRFHRAVAKKQARLLHAHFAVDGAFALALVEHLKIPSLVTLHGYDVTLHQSELGNTIEGSLYLHRRKRLWKTAHLFLCVSEFIRDKALHAGFPKDKLIVHYIGIDRKRFSAPLRSREPLVLFVGRLIEKKGCSYLLQAMKVVQREMPSAQLCIIGQGRLSEQLHDLAQELGVRCSFLGLQPTDVVRQWLEKCRVLCVPSITAANGDSEGLPTVIMEAHATGVPVVAYDHAGIPEIVVHNHTGLLSAEGDVESLADGLMRYLKDDLLWRTSSVAAQARVARHFDLTTQTESLEAIYDGLCCA
jgi:colanic acid/amylovoran biosynthesis glycosyltransferase